MIKKLNIDFDKWEELNENNVNIKLFIDDKEDKYALYLNREQYFDIFVLYLKKNNIELYWRSGSSALKNLSSSYNRKDNFVLYKRKNNDYKLTISDLDSFLTLDNDKIKLLRLI